MARNIGINFPAPNNYSPISPYANIAYLASPWQVSNVNSAVDSFGNPTTSGASMYFGQSKYDLGGVYNVRFNSSTAVTVTTQFGIGTISNYVFNAGVSTCTLTIPQSQGNGGNIGLAYSGATGGIQNLSITRVTENAGTSGAPFPLSISSTLSSAAYKSITVAGTTIRMLDLTSANATLESTWAQRATPSNVTRNAGQYLQTCWEHCVQFANENNNHLYINVPVNANAAYITNLANLLLYGSDGTNPYTSVQANPVWPPLNSNLNIYVEMANEIWNTLTPLFGQMCIQTATSSIAVTSVSSTTGVSQAQTVYQGASLGTATWTALMCATQVTSGSGTYYVNNETGTYTPGGTITNNTASGNPTAVGGVRTASTDAVALWLDTNFKNDFYGNLYRKVTTNLLLISEGFRAVWGASQMPENGGRIRPVLMAQLGYDAGPLASMFTIFSPILDNSNGLGLSVPGVTTRAPREYLYGMGCSFYYSPQYQSASITAANAVSTGTAITFTYTAAVTNPLTVGSTLSTSGFTFTGFTNGVYTITASSTLSVTIAATSTAGASSTVGTIQSVPNGANDMFGTSTNYRIGTYTYNNQALTYDTGAFQSQLANTARWAATFGVKFCAYEGFWSFDTSNAAGEYSILSDSRAIPKILAYQNAWDSVGGDLACAYTMGNAGSNWNLVYDQFNPTASTKYAGWLATISASQQPPTFWPTRGQSVPGGAWATALHANYVAMTPSSTASVVAGTGAFFSYVWGIPLKANVNVQAFVTVASDSTVDIFVNGKLSQSAAAIGAGTTTINSFNLFSPGPLFSIGYRVKTGSITINAVQCS